MKLSNILAQRQALLRQARLANLAFAYETLDRLATRIDRGRLSGYVCLKQAAPDAERYCASLTAIGGSQSVIEEHFTDEDIMDLADVLSFITGSENLDLTFCLEDMAEAFLTPLRAELEQAGVAIDPHVPSARETQEP